MPFPDRPAGHPSSPDEATQPTGRRILPSERRKLLRDVPPSLKDIVTNLVTMYDRLTADNERLRGELSEATRVLGIADRRIISLTEDVKGLKEANREHVITEGKLRQDRDNQTGSRKAAITAAEEKVRAAEEKSAAEKERADAAKERARRAEARIAALEAMLAHPQTSEAIQLPLAAVEEEEAEGDSTQTDAELIAALREKIIKLSAAERYAKGKQASAEVKEKLALAENFKLQGELARARGESHTETPQNLERRRLAHKDSGIIRGSAPDEIPVVKALRKENDDLRRENRELNTALMKAKGIKTTSSTPDAGANALKAAQKRATAAENKAARAESDAGNKDEQISTLAADLEAAREQIADLLAAAETQSNEAVTSTTTSEEGDESHSPRPWYDTPALSHEEKMYVVAAETNTFEPIRAIYPYMSDAAIQKRALRIIAENRELPLTGYESAQLAEFENPRRGRPTRGAD